MAVVINVVGNYDGREIDKAVRDLQKLGSSASDNVTAFGKSMQTAGQRISSIGMAITKTTIPAILGLGAAAYKSIQAASDLQETVSKVGVLFEGSAGEIEAWAETASTAFGQSSVQAMNAAATFAIFGKSAGLTGNELTSFATDFTELASDLASFNNTSPEDAITAIGAALRGETEPIRRYGVLLDDASLRQEALSQGIITTTKQALTPQQRVLAAQALIMKQTTAAQGDFARTSDGLANQQRILQAELTNVKAEIGAGLLPVALQLATAFRENVLPVISKFAEVIKNATPEQIQMAMKITALVAAVGPLLTIVGKLTTSIGGLIVKFGTGAAGIKAMAAAFIGAAAPVAAIIGIVAGVIAILVALWRESEVFRKAVTTAFNTVKTAISQAVGTIVSALRRNSDTVDTLKAAFKAVGDFIGRYIIPIFQGVLVVAIKVVAFQISMWIDIIGKLIDWFSRMVNAIKAGAAKVAEFFRNITQAAVDLKDKFVESLGRVGEIGEMIVTKIWEGISGRFTWIADKIKGWFGDLVDVGVSAGAEKVGAATASATKAGVYMAEGYVAGIVAAMPRATSEQKAAWDNAVENLITTNEETVKSAAKDTAKKYAEALAKRLEAQKEKVRNALTDLISGLDDRISEMTDSITNALDSVRDAADDMVARAESRVSDLTAEFASLKAEAKSFAQSVSSSLRSAFSLREAADPEAEGGLLATLRRQVEAAQTFAGQLRQLRSLGLNQGSLDEIIAAGVAQGTQIAAAVLSGGTSAITEINQLEATLRQEAESLGAVFAEDRFGAEMRKAQENLNLAQQALAAATASRDAIVAQIDAFRKRQDEILGRQQSALDAMVGSLSTASGDLTTTIGGILRMVNATLIGLSAAATIRTSAQSALDVLEGRRPTTPAGTAGGSVTVQPGAVVINAQGLDAEQVGQVVNRRIRDLRLYMTAV